MPPPRSTLPGRCSALLFSASAAIALVLVPAPKISRRALSVSRVINAADRRTGAVAPGEVLVLFPANAGPSELAVWPAIFPRNLQELQEMRRQPYWRRTGWTRVLFDGVPAPVVYTTRGEVETIVPGEVAGRKTTRVVIEYRDARSVPLSLPLAPAAPAIFTLDGSGAGQAAMLNETGCCNSVRNPAPRGSIVSLYATGEGRPANPQSAVKVTVGGIAAPILYAANLGVFVVNFRVPEDTPAGDAVPVVLKVGAAASPAGVTMAIRSAARNVVVADRDPQVRERLVAVLNRAGYGAEAARDSEQAARIGHPVDVVVLDLAPAQENLDILAALRTVNPKVKILGILDSATPESLRAADVSGADAVVERPVAAEVLLRPVAELARERPARY